MEERRRIFLVAVVPTDLKFFSSPSRAFYVLCSVQTSLCLCGFDFVFDPLTFRFIASVCVRIIKPEFIPFPEA